ncbi:unnamed protein product, partial [Ectocarpus sp. 12 AP-2014]
PPPSPIACPPSAPPTPARPSARPEPTTRPLAATKSVGAQGGSAPYRWSQMVPGRGGGGGVAAPIDLSAAVDLSLPPRPPDRRTTGTGSSLTRRGPRRSARAVHSAVAARVVC